MTLPSISNQIYKNYTYLIYTSTLLPDLYKQKLIDLTKNNSNIQIVYVENFTEFFEDIDTKLKNKTNYFTMRLDDDDGLNKNLLLTISEYNTDSKYIVSFPNGKNYTLQNNKIIFGKRVFIKNVAAGLVACNMSIYNCGNHTRINKRYKVYYNNMKDAYLLCCSKLYCDSKRSFW